ncbi:MAG: ABC transporter permease [Deltaproteobacteria bacterium]|nr:ABC transporter permease [Deltaproteobacteria bacterium]
MFAFILRRIYQSVLVLFCVSLVVFAILYLSGDPIQMLLPADASQEQIDEMRRHLGLDEPFWAQYLSFLRNALQGDMGRSFTFNQPAVKLILERAPATLELAVSAMILAILLGIPAGLFAAVKPKSWLTQIIMSGSLFGISLPVFWMGIMLIMVFSVFLGWLPSSGRGQTASFGGIQLGFLTWDGCKHLLMPAFTLAIHQVAMIVRLVRAGMMEVMLQDYIKFLRAKGLSERRVVLVHALKNIMIPVVTIIGLQTGYTIAFAIVTESIFAWPGMGKLVIDAIHSLDRPVILAYLLVVALMFVFINFMVDLTYSFLDPRIRLK